MQRNGHSVLVGDFGGTNVRLAIACIEPGKPIHIGAPMHMRTAALKSLEAAVASFFAQLPESERPSRAYLAVAGPVSAGRATLTNVGLGFSEDSLRAVGFAEVRLLNDFEALAYAVPQLPPEQLIPAGGPAAGDLADGFAVLGAGTGFGVARGSGADAVVVTEGGHIGFAPGDDAEIEILRAFQQLYGRVSIERILSGPGLITLYGVVRRLGNAADQPEMTSSHEIIAAALRGAPIARRAVEHFVRIFGSVAGDFALALGARGGVFLAGGATRALGKLIASPLFRARFEDKGRFRDYVSSIPTQIIAADNAAHFGLAHLAALGIYGSGGLVR